MAGPQLEDGFTQIANELLERLAAACLSGREMSVMLILARLSYAAFKRRKVSLPIDKIAYFLEIDRSNASKLLARMEKKGLILRVKAGLGRSLAEFSIQKNWTLWEVSRAAAWPPLLRRQDTLDDMSLCCDMSATQEGADRNTTDPLCCDMSATQRGAKRNTSDRETHTSVELEAPPRGKIMGKRSPYGKTGGSQSLSGHEPESVIEEAKKELFRITDIAPSTKDYQRVKAIARIPTPSGRHPDEWKDHCLRTAFDCLAAVANEYRRGIAIGSVYAVACTRARQKLQTEALQS